MNLCSGTGLPKHKMVSIEAVSSDKPVFMVKKTSQEIKQKSASTVSDATGTLSLMERRISVETCGQF